MFLFIKICGITRPEDAVFAQTFPVNALGFIAFPGSPRYISPEKVKKICSILKREIRRVGVFVNASLSDISRYMESGIDVLQLHGEENADFAKELAKSAEVWKAIRPKNKIEVEIFKFYPASKFLVDAFNSETRGGTGKQTDREIAKFAARILPAPLLLAGGLNPENIVEIVRNVKPFGVDVNSGVESSPGVKDHSKIKKLFSELEKLER